MPKTIDNNHTGNIVLFLYPTPNSLKEPSILYKNDGFIICIVIKIIKNNIIATKGVLFLAKCLNIYNILLLFIIYYLNTFYTVRYLFTYLDFYNADFNKIKKLK